MHGLMWRVHLYLPQPGPEGFQTLARGFGGGGGGGVSGAGVGERTQGLILL